MSKINYNWYKTISEMRELCDEEFIDYEPDTTLLELVELYAEDQNRIDSEKALSDYFDENYAAGAVKRWGTNDKPAINEAFSTMVDNMTNDGEIHYEQYMSYDYVGTYS